MSNSVKFSVDGDTNVEQVTDKVKKSISTLEKNIQGVESKFKSFGKDLFLSFAAPMVLLNSAMNMISSAIEKNQQKVQDARDLATKGESKFVTSGQTQLARENARREQEKKERELAKVGAEAETKKAMEEGGFMGFGGEGDAIISEFMKRKQSFGGFLEGVGMYLGINDAAGNEEIQKIAQERSAARDAEKYGPEIAAKKKEEEALAAQKAAAEAQVAAKKEVDSMSTTFKGPEGFGNVIGVGANPVLEAMNSQLEEQRTANRLLEQLVSSNTVKGTSWMSTQSPKAVAAVLK